MPALLQLLFLLFVGLKLTGQIDWSWWGITAPLWGYVMVTFTTGVVIGVVRGYKKARKRAGTTESP